MVWISNLAHNLLDFFRMLTTSIRKKSVQKYTFISNDFYGGLENYMIVGIFKDKNQSEVSLLLRKLADVAALSIHTVLRTYFIWEGQILNSIV